ncbi:MAG: branched-chain amino acid ABC transporter permease [Betaproteobacteria bacterium]|jgi:branched-chain amino acid transport system permease protein
MSRSDFIFLLALLGVGVAVFLFIHALGEGYYVMVAFYILEYIVLATAWNILGGYGGYVNFGSACFFALGAYSTVFFNKLFGVQSLSSLDLGLFVLDARQMPYCLLLLAMLLGSAVSGLVGLGTGYLTLRLRGVFFAISTLALSVVTQTLILNWRFVGGARGAYVLKPPEVAGFSSTSEFIMAAMLSLALLSIWIARWVENNKLGVGLQAIRDDEFAAECSGVPTLRLKLQATSLSGALMGAAGAIFPFFVTYVDPIGAFNLVHTVNSIAMPLIGGMTHWSGPLMGAILLGGIQQYFGSKNIITPELSLLFVGFLMMVFVSIAPNGILGLLKAVRAKFKS